MDLEHQRDTTMTENRAQLAHDADPKLERFL